MIASQPDSDVKSCGDVDFQPDSDPNVGIGVSVEGHRVTTMGDGE